MERRFAIAPMMEWTDRHCRFFHRLLTRRALIYTEMVTSSAVLRGDRARLIGFDPFEHPVAIQLGGSEPRALAQSARIAEDFGYDEVNLNVGCPSDRVQDQTILDQGPEIGTLLASVQENAARTGEPAGLMPYVGGLVEGWRARDQPQLAPSSRPVVVQPLSTREGDILKLIAQGRSNKEISRTLAIAPETVKSHVKHIFIKLPVERRAQAVSRAQSLGLVNTP
jgi:DNA-binding CsgD family transcriptional regulator